MATTNNPSSSTFSSSSGSPASLASTLFLLNDNTTTMLNQGEGDQQQPVATFTAANIAKYYPENTSFWMYAMIGLGSSFMVFVVLTIYLLCKPEKQRRPYYSMNTANTMT